MKIISLKLEKEFLKEMEKIMKKHNYMTKTEFIREAIRDKIKDLKEFSGSKDKDMKNDKEKNNKKFLNLSYVQ
ncbi:MAG: ribbon-helix-helix domain-containing protein [Candidatus Pacearchaeota archaeon]